MARTRALAWWVAVAMVALAPPAGGATSRKLAIERGQHARYRITTPHFEVEFTIPPQAGRTYGVLCERAYKNFRKKFNVPKDEIVWEGKCRVYLFARRKEFTQFASNVHKSHAAAESGGYTRITKENPDIVLFLANNDHTRLRQTLVHEMTHVFLQLFRREAHIHTWLHEGFAQYFEFRCDPKRSRLRASRARIKRLVRRGKQAPLRKFWQADFPGTDLDSYAQAWSLVDFMVSRGSAKKTGNFILLIKEGETQEEALHHTFKCSLEQFERAWQRYVLQAY